MKVIPDGFLLNLLKIIKSLLYPPTQRFAFYTLSLNSARETISKKSNAKMNDNLNTKEYMKKNLLKKKRMKE